jgi:hypothetical protein
MPSCDGIELDVLERLPGDGIDGNGYSVDVGGSPVCRNEWVQRLENDPRFRCGWHQHGTSCDRGELGTGETVTVHIGDKAVNRVIWIRDWSKA